MNGVRFNEPFGDTVNWDLIPQGAIESMSLAPGHQLEVSGGSWERHSEEFNSGWNNGTWGYAPILLTLLWNQNSAPNFRKLLNPQSYYAGFFVQISSQIYLALYLTKPVTTKYLYFALHLTAYSQS